MKVELWLRDRDQPVGQENKFEVDLPSIPQKGDIIMLDDEEGYRVTETVFRLDSEGRFTGRVSVDAVRPMKDRH